MSRTYKDQPARVRFPEPFDCDRVPLSGYFFRWIQVPGVRTKKPKDVDTEHHWMTTPGHWTHIMMNRPQRARENQQLRCIYDLEDFDFVDTKRKPHIYYW